MKMDSTKMYGNYENGQHKNVWKLWKIESTKMYGNYGKWQKYGTKLRNGLQPVTSLNLRSNKKEYIYILKYECIYVSRCFK